MDTCKSSPTMLAAVVERFGQPYTLKQIPRPPPPQGQDILVKVLAASYCHTDSVFALGGLSQDLPRIGCHEFAGEVVSVGSDVPTRRGLAPGVRVGVPGRAYHPCGSCFECSHPGKDEVGYSPYCPNAGNLGLTRDGGFQEYCLVDSRQVAPLPDGLAATQAAPMMCAGLTIWSALHHEKVRNTKRVGIIGAGGGLGHLGVQFGAHLGLDILAIDASDQALRLLERIKNQLGPAGTRVEILDARNLDTEEKQLAASSSQGVEAIILLPESQRAFDMGIKLLKNHGTMVVVSFPQKKLEVSAHDIVFRDISIMGSLVGRNHQLREMLAFVVRHQISAEIETFPFPDINHLVEQSHMGAGGKLVVDMTLPRPGDKS